MWMFIREKIVGIISTSFLAVPLLCRHTHGFKVTTFFFFSNLYNNFLVFITQYGGIYMYSTQQIDSACFENTTFYINCIHL